MAAKKRVILAETKKQKCTFVEEDIPDAALPRESEEECSMVQLKRWLTCRGAKTSEKECFGVQASWSVLLSRGLGVLHDACIFPVLLFFSPKSETTCSLITPPFDYFTFIIHSKMNARYNQLRP